MWDGKILVRRGRFLWHATFSYGLIEVYSGNTPKHWYGLTERQAVNRVRRYVQKHAIETVARSYGVK